MASALASTNGAVPIAEAASHSEQGVTMTISPPDLADLPDFPIPRECPYRPSAHHVGLGETGPMTKVKLYNGRTAWLVTGAAQARAVLSDYRRVSIRPYHGNYPLLNEEFEKVVDSGYADVLFGVDPPEHTRQRSMIMPPREEILVAFFWNPQTSVMSTL